MRKNKIKFPRSTHADRRASIHTRESCKHFSRCLNYKNTETNLRWGLIPLNIKPPGFVFGSKFQEPQEGLDIWAQKSPDSFWQKIQRYPTFSLTFRADISWKCIEFPTKLSTFSKIGAKVSFQLFKIHFTIFLTQFLAVFEKGNRLTVALLGGGALNLGGGRSVSSESCKEMESVCLKSQLSIKCLRPVVSIDPVKGVKINSNTT